VRIPKAEKGAVANTEKVFVTVPHFVCRTKTDHKSTAK